MKKSLLQTFVGSVYATHNQSRPIKEALARCFATLGKQDVGLNVDAGGGRRLHPAILNFDLIPSDGIDCAGTAESLPFADNAFAVIISQEALEHVSDPFQAVREIHRVMKPGGLFYCQVPFIIGYHPGPTDFWRFTKEGIRKLIEQSGLTCEMLGVAVGPATGFYRIVVEFFATLAARISRRAYRPAKGFFAVLFYPLKWLDGLLYDVWQVDRIAGGYFVIARKKSAESGMSHAAV